MVDLFIVFVISIITIIPISISSIMLLKAILESPSFYEFQLLISSLMLVVWTIGIMPIYLTPELLTNEQVVLGYHIITIFGPIGVLFLIFSFINTFNKVLVIIPRLTIVGFTVMIGAKIVQFHIPPSETVYGIKVVNNQLVRITPPFIAIDVFLSFLAFYLCLLMFVHKQNSLPSYLVAENTKRNTRYALIIFTFGIIIQVFATVFISDFYLSGTILILSRITLTTGFMFIVLQFTKNPMLTFSEKGNPAKFITNGTVNWILIANGNMGPEAIKYSGYLDKYFSKDELKLCSIRLLTANNLGGEEYREDICIIPFTNKKFNLVGIGFSFNHKDSNLKDPRRKNKAELLFAIIIPQLLLPYLENITINAMRDPIFNKREKTVELEDFVQKTDFNNLTMNLLKNLNNKQIF